MTEATAIHILPVLLFCISCSVTPGPNNIMIMSSGLNYGVRASMQHLFGICFGFVLMMLIVGLGLGSVFQSFPVIAEIIKYAGMLYLLYLAWKIASSSLQLDSVPSRQPMGFVQAMIFQWVNPKAWVMIASSISAYASEAFPSLSSEGQVLMITLIFFVVGSPCVAIWLFFGAALKRVLKNPVAQKRFNIAMAVLLVISVAWVM